MEDIFNGKEGISMDIFPRYHNKDIRPTKEASEELVHLNKGLWLILEILENGYDCSSSKRKKEIIEKCVTKGDAVYKAVVADCGYYWLLIHFGKFIYKRR